ncbi:AAA family ATPase [Paraburkholderia hospita]|uniref:AAA family ATPase n=1 Tax=Paraburkholderia hospita TaxID=169430 RepID=UPI0009A732D7|nr:AAA family ATPase [Paraburkholderia hospita]OUL70271.1 OLD family endonuclease [Paraburkholderia hospita]SKD04831.1 P-loop containing region of AAA domain-containing protein [Burkholderia sp. CF099]
MHFQRLQLEQWQQFHKIDIDLTNRLTILTGANGSGKSTILGILARHNGWEVGHLAVPRREKTSGVIRFFSRFLKGVAEEPPTPAQVQIGNVQYSNGVPATLLLPTGNNSPHYQLSIAGFQHIPSFFIPSHRANFRYEPIGSIPATKKDKQQAFNEVSGSARTRYMGGHTQSSSFFMKNSLISWAIQGYGVSSGDNKHIMPPDAEQRKNFEGFQEALRKILPSTLGFKEIEIRNMEIVFVCNNGDDEFMLETASGGITALIDIAWQIYMFAPKDNSEFTVIIDEVENHLHPTMQRRLLQDLLNAFPTARFIVSTHSPLVVSSVRDASVYALRYNADKKVEATKLDLLTEAKTAGEILDEVLGVSFTMPIWAENRLNEIVGKFNGMSAEQIDFRELRKELTDSGLEKTVPYAIEKVVRNK